jgi:putative DNA primase/helicase
MLDANDMAQSTKSTIGEAQEAETVTYGSIKLADLAEPWLRGKYRYCPELGWLAFTGAKWETSGADDLVLGEIVTTVKQYAAHLVGEKRLDRDAIRELAVFSSGGCQGHAQRILRSRLGIRTPIDQFDAQPAYGQPHLLHCANGWTIELHADGTVTPRTTSPDDLNTKVACAYDPDARAPKTAAAFAKYQPDEDVRRYLLQQWAKGLSGQGSQTFTAHLGGEKEEGKDNRGGNGKSTMMILAGRVAGEYAETLPVEVILKSRRGTAREVFRSELAGLRGARLVFVAEPEAGAKLASGVIKDLTGGATITGRLMNRDPVSFIPRIVLSLSSNNRPSWDADGGMDRRYIEISWLYEIPREEMRESFTDELAEETSGFLNAILTHWTGTAPLTPPDIIVRSTEAGKNASSPVYRFREEGLEVDPTGAISGKMMYEAYSEWCRQNGQAPVSSTKLGRELPRLGIDKGHSVHGVRYVGFRVVETYL